MSKTYKHEYTGSKKIDRTCRNHGVCPKCAGNRKYQDAKKRRVAEAELQDLERFYGAV